MSTAAVASAVPVDLVPTLADDSRTTVDAAAALKDEALASHAAELKAGKNGDEVSKDALYKLVDVIGTKTAEFVSRDLLLAHTLLLSHFHHQLRDGDNEAKDLAFLCAAETRYIAYLDAVAKAAIKDKALVDALPLPPMDVAMFLHSHMLSPLRFADDMTRRYGPTFVGLSLPLVRLAKAASGGSKDDLETGRAFWAKYLPANMPYSFTPADVDETKAVGRVSCPLCKSELVLSVAEYAALRLHGRAHECMSCACNFTAEHMAVCRFLTMVMNAPLARIAGTQSHPKTRQPMPMHSGNMADLAMLFDQGEWAKYGAALPQLATWADVENMIMVPIMKASAGSLNLPGNRRRFAMVIHAHQDVTTGPWAMDMVRAVRRQRRFSANIARTVQSGMGGVYHFHTKALVQYPKFLAMIVAHPGTSIVPTPEIDLAWHTHQLSPLVYGMHGCALMGCILNHDDSDDAETKAVIADGAKETAELWMHDFGEDYFNLRLPCADGAKYQATETALINHVAHAAHTTQHADCRSYRGGSEAAAMTPDADVSGFCRMCVPDWGANKANSASDASGFCRMCVPDWGGNKANGASDASGFCRMCVPDWGANKANSASDASGFCRMCVPDWGGNKANGASDASGFCRMCMPDWGGNKANGASDASGFCRMCVPDWGGNKANSASDASGFCRMCVPDWGANKANSASDASGFCRMCVPDWGANKANSASDASGFCRMCVPDWNAGE